MFNAAHGIRIPLAEFDCSYARSSGPGGQNVNKVNSKCFLRWDVTGSPSIHDDVRHRFLQRYANRLTTEGFLVVSSDRFRDQKRNFDDCLQKLGAMLETVALPPKKRTKTKPTRASKRRRLDTKRVHGDKKAQRRTTDWD